MSHRPFPTPSRPWVMHMTWRHLLFAHWPVPVDALRPHVPETLDIDTHDDTAWLGVVPFLMDDVHPRFVPIPMSFPELNLRTYVTPRADPDTPGVWFFSLDAASRIGVEMARRFFHLPYFNARMSCDADGDQVTYRSTRTDSRAPGAQFDATYRAIGDPVTPDPLDRFLTDRYCLYAADPRGRLHRGHIHHDPWPLRRAEADLRTCDMTALVGLEPPQTTPHLLFADRLDVVAWTLETVR